MVTAWRLSAAAASVALAAATHPLHSQTLRGQVVEAGTNRPVEAAMISLWNSAGVRVSTAWSDASGRFFMFAPAAGEYTLRVDRIGYETVTSPVIELTVGKVLDHRMELPMQPITLAELTVVGEDRNCAVRSNEMAAATARVWTEARKALDAAVRSERERGLRFEGVTYRRRLDLDGERVLEDEMRPHSGTYAKPFGSRPAEELAREGYIRAVDGGKYFDFFAPSAEVLLSDSFVEHHCMRLVPGQGEAAGLVGLAFEPVRGRNVPDIQGTFWLDAHSAQLRYLEFTYVAPNSRYPTAGARGRVDFATLPNGAWFVRRWFIRMPLTEISSVWGVTSMPQVRTVAFQVDGGEITRVHLPGREPIDVAVRARIDGIVRDGTTGKPLGGATVRLSGTTYRTVANEAGRFRFSEIPPGVYGVEFWHPRLDSLPVAALPSVEIAVTEGDIGPIELAVPPLDRILAEACPVLDPDVMPSVVRPGEPTGVVVGTVRDPETGLLVAGAPVAIQWARDDVSYAGGQPVMVRRVPLEARTVTGENGRFWVCYLPFDIPIRAMAALPDGRTIETTFSVSRPIEVITLDAPRPADAGYTAEATT